MTSPPPQPDADWTRLERWFQAAVAAPERRGAILAEAAAEDSELARELAGLLDADASVTEAFLAPPSAASDAARRLRDDLDRLALDEHATGADPLVGTDVGGYRILERLGTGGMGVVYRARQADPERDVALKIVHPSLASPRMVRRFRREAEFLARLDHPGVARVIAAGTHDDGGGGRPWFAMELVPDARTITRYASEHRLSRRDRVILVLEAARAVAHGHAEGLVHRDLKPGNILVGPDGRPRVIDFGIARATDGDLQRTTMRTETGQLLGTLGYMSPEQCEGPSSAVDGRADVYAIGSILYELLAGRPPLDLHDRTVAEALRRIREAPPTRLSKVVPGLDEQLATVVDHALAKSADHRYPSMAALVADLERWLRAEPVHARRPSIVVRAALFARRNRGLTAAVLALVSVLAATSLVSSGFAVALAASNARERAARDRSERVAEFLTGTLTAGSAWSVRGGARTAQDVLDDAAARVAEELAGDPEARWRVHEALALAYRAQGLPEEAAREARLGLAAARLAAPDEQGRMQEPALRLATPLAAALQDLGRTDEAEAVAREALTAAEASWGAEDPGTVRLRARLASIELVRGRPAAAIDILEACVADLERTGRTGFEIYLDAKTRLGLALTDVGRPESAEPIFRTVLERYRDGFGPSHPDVVEAMNNLGWCLQAQGRVGEAIRWLEQALERSRAVLGPRHPMTAFVGANLGGALLEARDVDRAEPLLREALDVYEQTTGLEGRNGAMLISALGRSALIRGDVDEAIDRATTSLDIFRTVFGPDSMQTARGCQWLAKALVAADRAAEAEPLLRDSLRIVESVTGPGTDAAALALNELAFNLMAQDRQAEAEPLFRRALEIREVVLESGHPERLLSMHNHARCLVELGRADEAVDLLARTVAGGEETHPPGHLHLAIFRYTHAAALMQLGRPEDAVGPLEAALPRLREILGPEHARVAQAESLLAEIRAALAEG